MRLPDFVRTLTVPPLGCWSCLQELLAEEGMETLLTCGAMSKPPGDVNGIDPDHLVSKNEWKEWQGWQPSRCCEAEGCGGSGIKPGPPGEWRSSCLRRCFVHAPQGGLNNSQPANPLQFMTLLRADLLRDLLFLYNPVKQQLHTCMSVSSQCGAVFGPASAHWRVV